MRLLRVGVVVGLVAGLAVGCGGAHDGGARGPGDQPQPPVMRPAPALRAVEINVVDGDTGQRLPHAALTVSGAVKRGGSLFTRPHTKSLTVTSWAPHYGARTLSFSLGAERRLTVRLYRTDGQWRMYGVTPARTQVQAGIRLRPPFRVVWGKYLGTLLEFPAVVDNGTAYISNLRGRLYALSMKDGSTKWRFDLRSREQDSSPAVVGKTLVAHSKSGRVYVLDRATGRMLWSRATAGRIESSPVVQNGVDYLGDWAGDVYALDLHTRKARWVYHDGCKITASVTIAGNALYLGDYCGRVLALERSTGRLLWSRGAGGVVYGTSATSGGRLFVPVRSAGALYAFTTRGDYLWHVSTGGLVYSAPAVWKGRVYFGSYTGWLYCVSARTGEVIWRVSAGGAISGSPTVIDGVVYAGSFAHKIVGADARTGRILFSFPHGEYVAVSGNRGRLLLYGWATLWAVEPKNKG